MNYSLDRQQIKLWHLSIYFIFALPGFSMASWVSRTPTIRDALGASTAQMGWIIFGMAVGSIVGLMSASHLIAHKGGRFVMVTGLVISSIGLIIVGVGGSWIINSIIVFLGLAIFGFGNGICDVAMNVEGTAVEGVTKKSLLTGFHAAFSVGTLLGAIVGSVATKSGVSVPVHITFAAIITVLSIIFLARFVPIGTGKENNDDSNEPPMSARERMAVWKEPRTILISIIVLGMAFAEGSANDWLPLIIVDGYSVTPTMGSFAFGLFVAAMTIGRAIGGLLLDRLGRVLVLRISALLAIVGLLIVIFGGNYKFATIGIVLWGLGAAFGFPVGLSAAGDDPRGVAARVSAVATAGYLAFLVGPPFLGFVGEMIGLLRALIVVLITVTIAGLLSQAAKPIGKTNK
ncbi:MULTISPECIES: MFS transporter [Priestia]|uniref:MFS transporter n=1 Tax=Priestia TaxID=2800373 RepID=UPI0011A371A5|nr:MULTISPECIES: MFS transporter [Priestia]MBK0006195.1 MFS transporter [Bacillus sp. S35]MCM3639933.1 MFS transporter [Priestia aryabhattai]